ncbi:MAG: PucR family transcriptional regulator [Anaerovoracaceae bacterium]|jgi:hypothetical protein
MVTVQDLMADTIFDGFRLVAGRYGLSNEVSGTGIFDWEEPRDVAMTFTKGEFVITTLSDAKHHPKDIFRRVKALIEIQASAICIKTVYFKSVSREVVALANKNNIPVFLFEDTYIDDIIFAVRNALQGGDSKDAVSKEVEEILWSEKVSPEVSEKTIRRISPFIYEHFICIYATPRYQKDRRVGKLIDNQYEKSVKFFHERHADTEKEFLVALCLRGALLIICSRKQPKVEGELYALADEIISELSLGGKLYIGISGAHDKRSEFASALKESMYANISATVDREMVLTYRELGTDALLIPICNHNWIRSSYESDIGKLRQYDQKHNAKLVDTLLTYAESAGVVSLTATKMLRHENTIRKRLARIQELLGIEDQEDAYVHMYLLARFYRILQVMLN